MDRQVGLESFGEGVAAGAGLADARIAPKDLADIAAAPPAFGVDALVEGRNEGPQRGFAPAGEDFAKQLGAVARGQAAAPVARGEGLGYVAQKRAEQRLGGRDAGRPRGFGEVGGDFG